MVFGAIAAWVLAQIGFGANGAIAAAVQSKIGIVAVGSVFAIIQSVAMGGGTILSMIGLIRTAISVLSLAGAVKLIISMFGLNAGLIDEINPLKCVCPTLKVVKQMIQDAKK
ncbi:putative_F-box protein [Hexamita inflata]|uniref:F-box protein n=1 Tax=Hexamita inflata TaxID=28002 RepID=A0AA86N4T9_9EUKA|nr:putative F-box protein [Hexamita inflata]CAI9956743.1 putative F-box protein [Hexamita inflata]